MLDPEIWHDGVFVDLELGADAPAVVLHRLDAPADLDVAAGVPADVVHRLGDLQPDVELPGALWRRNSEPMVGNESQDILVDGIPLGAVLSQRIFYC